MATYQRTLLALLITTAAVCGAYALALRQVASAEDDPARGGPVAVATATTCDLGKVRADGTVEAAFSVRNAGTRRLILRESASGCECLSAAQPEITVPPGATRKLIVRLDTGKGLGPLKIESHYSTNDPRRPVLTVTLLADIQRP